MRSVYICLSLLIVSILLTYSIGAFYSYCYPMKFVDEITSYSLEYGIDPALVASVINVESGYDEEVVSSKDAMGLMQILPSTGKWLAQKIGEDYQEECLLDGKYNIKIGTYYLSYLLNQFSDRKVAICAYNAGQGNVKAWLGDKQCSSDGKTLKYIPFEETRNYVNKVEKNYSYYRNRYSKLATNN